MPTDQALATISVAGQDPTWNLYSGAGLLESRIAQELNTRGLVVMTANKTTDFSLLTPATYGFLYTADINSDDPFRQWNVELIRSAVIAAVQAATTYIPTVSLTKTNIPVIS